MEVSDVSVFVRVLVVLVAVMRMSSTSLTVRKVELKLAPMSLNIDSNFEPSIVSVTACIWNCPVSISSAAPLAVSTSALYS